MTCITISHQPARRAGGEKFLDMAYYGLGDRDLAKMVIALRTPDCGELLPRMLKQLDDTNRANPHYLGMGATLLQLLSADGALARNEGELLHMFGALRT